MNEVQPYKRYSSLEDVIGRGGASDRIEKYALLPSPQVADITQELTMGPMLTQMDRHRFGDRGCRQDCASAVGSPCAAGDRGTAAGQACQSEQGGKPTGPPEGF